MTARRRLKADTIRVELPLADTLFYYNAYDRLGSLRQTLSDSQGSQVVHFTDDALDALYEALKVRQAHQEFLAAKYGADA